MPFRRRVFDGLPLPFFNNVNLEVYKTYGNTDEVVIKTTHFQTGSSKYASWRSAYDEFENRKSKAIQNTMHKIYNNNNNNNKNQNQNITKSAVNKSNVMKIMDNKFTKNQVELLSEIGEKDIGRIYVFSVDFIIQHAACIKFYFPNVVIEYFSYAREVEIILYLNYVDKLHVYNSFIEMFYNDPDIVYLNKPKIDIIKVITFGTFDMWHTGHSNLLSRCCKYSENICAGVSSDEFTFQKKQILPRDDLKKRLENVKRCKFVKKVFEETSMELKNEYIKLYSANILIMGDDWQDKFDWVDCCVIYLPRTPNISSTMLREQMNVKFA
jgi:glycerol-3-phosphate cytidylyltransferase